MWRRVPCPPSQRHHVAATPRKKANDHLKIDAKYNVSDGLTKPLSHAAYMLHLGYTHNII